jgi:hypothetical protein
VVRAMGPVTGPGCGSGHWSGSGPPWEAQVRKVRASYAVVCRRARAYASLPRAWTSRVSQSSRREAVSGFPRCGWPTRSQKRSAAPKAWAAARASPASDSAMARRVQGRGDPEGVADVPLRVEYGPRGLGGRYGRPPRSSSAAVPGSWPARAGAGTPSAGRRRGRGTRRSGVRPGSHVVDKVGGGRSGRRGGVAVWRWRGHAAMSRRSPPCGTAGAVCRMPDAGRGAPG